MVCDSPELLQLAGRLRELREQRWPDLRLTQATLARALGQNEPLAPATVSTWESQVAPKMPPPERLRAYARFFATRRSIQDEVPRLLPADSFSDEELAACKVLEEELLALREKAGKPGFRAEARVRRSWHFSDPGPVTIVCAQLPAEQAGSLADPVLPDFTDLQSFADLDALIELYGHLRAENPATDVFFRASTRVVPDDLSGHVVLLGRIAWNEITEILSEMTMMPIRQVSDPALDPGEIFVVSIGGEERSFLPKWRDSARTCLKEDIGLLARAPNPLNSNRTLTICNGVHGRGVLGAARSLTDARLRNSNENYLAEHIKNPSQFALLTRVPVIEGRTMTPDFNSPGCVLYCWPGLIRGGQPALV